MISSVPKSFLDSARYKEAYGILCSQLFDLNSRNSLYPSFCKVSDGQQTTAHSHYEEELFYIIEGAGQVIVEGKSSEVKAGDLVRIPSMKNHVLKNSGQGELAFLSVYSEDFEVPGPPANVRVTAAPPTPNGPLHLGHMSGPYLAADIIQRYFRLRQSQVRSHSGTDDHQNYVAEKARKLSQSTQGYRTAMRTRIEAGLENLNISFDEFIEPASNLPYQSKILSFYERAVRSGVIQQSEVEFPYCNSCEIYLLDSLIAGNCPNCQERSSGVCESCGWVVSPMDLKSPCCNRCEARASTRRSTIYQFPLHEYLANIERDLALLELPLRLRDLVSNVLQTDRLNVLVTYPRDPETSAISPPGGDQSLHVWFEMAAHYESFAHESEDWIHCFGFDNAFHYLLFIPALLRAMDSQAKLPNAVVINEFLQLDGQKFSTSRNHAIWADEFLGNTDHLRLYLSLQRPSGATSNFDSEKFSEFSSSIDGQVKKLCQRASTQKKSEDKNREISRRCLISCNRITKDIEMFLAPTQFDLRRAARRILEFVDLVLNSQHTVDEVRLMVQVTGTILSPIMPRASESILRSLGITETVWQTDWARI